MKTDEPNLMPGTEVEARGLRWQVVHVDDHTGSGICRLRGLGGIASGEEIDVLLALEDVTPIRHEFDPSRAGRLREWLLYHQAFLLEQALGPHALLAAQPGRLEIQPYQLVPVIRALAMSRVRLMLADGVGLGKTIEAGLVIAELMARRLAQRILIVSPAGPLLEQWRMEMRDRFGLRLRVVDRGTLNEVRREVELGANPFDHIPLALASIDFLKQERVLAELERASYDIIIVDEAHHCVDLGGAGQRDDSLRRRLAEVLAGRCDSLLLLTATPHDGNDRSFASLCELLDPSLVDSRGMVRGDRYQRHVVRRLKRHIRHPQTGRPMFAEREVKPCRVVVKAAEYPAFAELSEKVLALVAPELRRALRGKRYSDVLSFFALLKRSVSTVAACRSTLGVVLSRYREAVGGAVEDQHTRHERIRSLREARRRLDRFGVVSASEEAEVQELELEDVAQQLAELERESRSEGRKISREQSMTEKLEALVAIAENAVDHDPKIAALLGELEKIHKTEPNANVLVYTEYTTSQEAVANALRNAGHNVLTLSGDDPYGNSRRSTDKADDELRTRIEITERFRTADGIVLVCTDAAAEGLNLHQKCHHLIHLELPFNPNRLEQRNGRIDRYGQKFPPVVRYLHLAGTFEENILLRLIAKWERQRRALNVVPNTLGLTADSEMVMRPLLQGFIDTEATLFADQPVRFTLTEGDPADGAEGPVRELLAEIDRCFATFEKTAKSNAWLADAGLHADEATMKAAGKAHDAGDEAASVDLARFVVDAVLRQGGRLKGNLSDSVFYLTLPADWRLDLTDVPGCDPDSRIVRLTTNKEVLTDSEKRLVGYLGRAHPLVRHAIDRVRHTSLGTGDVRIDSRAAVVKANVSEPVLYCTFLGRVNSGAGRELERVLAVRLSHSSAPTYCSDAKDWLALASVDTAVSPVGVWEEQFASWAPPLLEGARTRAKDNFEPEGQAFLKDATERIAREKADLEKWVTERIAELAPVVVHETPDLFSAPTGPVTPPKPAPTTPTERLEAIQANASQPQRLRSQASALRKMYQQRLDHLALRSRFSAPEVIPLGLLMVIPDDEGGNHAA
jgi:superfamily II DNA or RNA helicase